MNYPDTHNQLSEIFNTLREKLKKYENPLVPKNNSDKYYDLWSIKDIVIEGKKRKEIYFAGIMIQKDYVGFYYMPVYTDTAIKEIFKPELLKLLKGKSCFHIKKLDIELEIQIDEALEAGYGIYKEHGWI